MTTKSISYRIGRINTLQFAIFPETFVTHEQVTVNTKFNFMADKSCKNVRCVVNIDYVHEKALQLRAQVACDFVIGEDSTALFLKNKRIPVDFLWNIGTITTGTARGIIYTRTLGTVFTTIILPPINMEDVIKDDLILNNNLVNTDNK